jgi:hypothetical protein
VVSEWSKERAWKARSRDKRLVGSNPTYSAIHFMVPEPTASERLRRNEVMARILDFIDRDEKILLPPFDPKSQMRSADFALLAIEENGFSGSIGPFRYQFEGEDDLLHLAIFRTNGGALGVDEARRVASFLLPEIPSALIWLRPGKLSQHFYVGHDELLKKN